MTESLQRPALHRKRETAAYDPDGRYSVPNAQELNGNIHRKCFSEFGGLVPVLGLVHLVCERYLLMIASRQHSYLHTDT